MVIDSMVRGALAGAAGTTALNAVTYLDMAGRGRGASDTPEATIDRLADAVDVEVPGSGEVAANRASALGAMLGIVTGVGVGAVYGALRGVGFRPRWWTGAALTSLAALAASNGPMVALGVTDIRSWSLADWTSDIVPHLAYGVVTAVALADAEGPR